LAADLVERFLMFARSLDINMPLFQLEVKVVLKLLIALAVEL
jgi:hypothetical protein